MPLGGIDRIAAQGGMGNFNPNDPFARGLASGSTGMLRDAGQQGYFDPAGSQKYRMGMRRRLLMQGRGRRNRASILARLAGLDQMGQGQALMDTEQDIAGTTANTLNDFDTGEYGQNRDYFRGQFDRQLGRQQDRQDAREAQRGQFMGGIGSLLGQGGLAFLTGGASLGIPKSKVRRAPDPGYGGTY